MRITGMSASTEPLTAADLPDPGEGRYWKILFNPKSRTNPMVIQLIESFRPGSPVGPVIGFDYAMANKKDLRDKAELILVRAADYKLMVGEYGIKEQTKE